MKQSSTWWEISWDSRTLASNLSKRKQGFWLLLWCWLFRKLERWYSSTQSKRIQVLQWLDYLLCWMSHNLGFQTANASSSINNQSWACCPFNVPWWCSPYNVLAWRNEGAKVSSHMYCTTCVLQGFWGQLKSPWISPLAKASTLYQAHQCVLSSLPWACTFKKD